MRLIKPRTELTPERKAKLRKRRIIVYSTVTALLVGAYLYQPIRIDPLPKRPPDPNPPVDPDSERLFAKGAKIALIQAHPDDSEFYMAPLLLRLKESGADIHQLVMTDGDKDYYFWQDNSKLRSIRQAEQRHASSHYASEILFLGRPDGRLSWQKDNVESVREFLERVQPDYVLAFDGVYWPRRSHADHREAGVTTRQAIESMRREKRPKWLLMYSTTAPNFFPGVDKTVDAGMELVKLHKSQFFGERLKMIQGWLMDGWYEAGQKGASSYAVPLRAQKLR